MPAVSSSLCLTWGCQSVLSPAQPHSRTNHYADDAHAQVHGTRPPMKSSIPIPCSLLCWLAFGLYRTSGPLNCYSVLDYLPGTLMVGTMNRHFRSDYYRVCLPSSLPFPQQGALYNILSEYCPWFSACSAPDPNMWVRAGDRAKLPKHKIG